MNLLQTEISWAQLKALHQIYVDRQTKAPLFSNAFLLRLKSERRLLRYKSGNKNYIEGSNAFPQYYETHFLTAYKKYVRFFEATGVLSDGRRAYSLYDLETLIYIWENKTVLSGNLTTMRTFSATLFKGKGSKYLENNQSVRAAVLKILEIENFPKSDPKENQWRLVVDCPEPKLILLCENLDALKMPDTSIAFHSELWYVGGNNTKILENLSPDKLTLPIYYMCDWDYDGLRIFENVQRIMACKATDVKLLIPYDLHERLPVHSPHHFSEWKRHLQFSGLTIEKYTASASKLIFELISKNEWIEEESQDLEKLLKSNGALN